MLFCVLLLTVTKLYNRNSKINFTATTEQLP